MGHDPIKAGTKSCTHFPRYEGVFPPGTNVFAFRPFDSKVRWIPLTVCLFLLAILVAAKRTKAASYLFWPFNYSEWRQWRRFLGAIHSLQNLGSNTITWCFLDVLIYPPSVQRRGTDLVCCMCLHVPTNVPLGNPHFPILGVQRDRKGCHMQSGCTFLFWCSLLIILVLL